NEETKEITFSVGDITGQALDTLIGAIKNIEQSERFLIATQHAGGDFKTLATFHHSERAYLMKSLEVALEFHITQPFTQRIYKERMKEFTENNILPMITERVEKIERLKNIYGDNWREHLDDEE